MEVIVMRHGERNDQPCYDRGFIGQGLELAPLTDNGVKQAEEAAKNPLIDGCSIIVSSPYTRCMQTAAIVSRIRNIPLKVEIDLHEWIPDLTFQNKKGEAQLFGKDFSLNQGKYPEGERPRWESIDMMEKRLLSVLNKYTCELKVCSTKKPWNPTVPLALPAAPELSALCVIRAPVLKGGKNVFGNNA